MAKADNQYKDGDMLNALNGKNLINPSISNLPEFGPKIKLGILASGNGSNFEYIIKAIQSKKLNAEISILIVNNPHCLAIKKAENNNIRYEVINHRDCISRDQHDKLVINSLLEYSVELVVMAGWMRIAGDDLINKYKGRLINIHPSLLPSFKGIDAIQQAINNKVLITGCTVHYVQREVDSGSIIIQAAVPVNEGEDKNTLQRRIQNMEHIILPAAIAIVAKRIRTILKDKKYF